MPGTHSSRATHKLWIMPRTGTAAAPVDSTASGVTATKGFNLIGDLKGGLPELEDKIGGTMTHTSGQRRAARVETAVRELGEHSLPFRTNLDPHHATNPVGAGTVFAWSVLDARGDNAAPWRVEYEYASGRRTSFDFTLGARKDMPAQGLDGDDAVDGFEITLKPSGTVTRT